MTPTIVRELPLTLIEPHQKNIRHDVGNVVDLSKSITAKGLLQPLVVAPVGFEDPTWSEDNPKRYVLIAGHRRRAACILAGINDAPCIVRADLDTEAKQLEAMLVENTQRTDLTVMEEARAIQGLLDLPGFNADKVAKSIGRSRSYVKERGKLTALGVDAEKRLTDRQMTLEQALIVAEFEGDEYSQDVLLNLHAWASIQEWKAKAVYLHRKREVQAKIPVKVQELRALGAELLDHHPSYRELREQGKDLVGVVHGDRRDFVPEEFEGWTAEQHIAAGHAAVVSEDTRAEVLWLVPAKEDEEPQLTDEELERRAIVDRINAGLEMAAHVRMEHLKDTLKSPPAALVDHVRDRMAVRLAQVLFKDPNLADTPNPFCEVATGLPATELGKAALIRKLKELDVVQLAIIEIFARRKYEESCLDKVHGWGPRAFNRNDEWLAELQDLWGWTFTDIEKEAIEHCRIEAEEQAAARAAQEAEAAAAKDAAGE